MTIQIKTRFYNDKENKRFSTNSFLNNITVFI